VAFKMMVQDGEINKKKLAQFYFNNRLINYLTPQMSMGY